MANTDHGLDARHPGLARQTLGAGHVALAVALSREAGWNQIDADWDYMIRHGHGLGYLDGDGRLVATMLTLTHGARFGWIGMVLVTRSWRRRGLATGLLRLGVDSLLASGRTPGLDATEAGRPLYLSLGFRDIYPLTRLLAPAPTVAPSEPAPPSRRIAAGDIDGIAVADREVFGADRRTLLQHLLGRAPALVASDRLGHAFGRDGRLATQIGPVVAETTATAIALTSSLLASVTGPAYIDVPDHQDAFLAWLSTRGFKPHRPFMRMLFARRDPFDDPARVFAIAGPELA